MKYKFKGCCESCSEMTWVRNDRVQGIVCKNCDEPTLQMPKPRYTPNYELEPQTQELYPKVRRAI